MIGGITGKSCSARLISLSLAVLLAAAPAIVEAQDNPAAPQAPTVPPAPPVTTPGMPEPAPAQAAPAAAAPAVAAPSAPAEQPVSTARFNEEELRKLLAPIALYPDPLLALMLPASAYPLLIVQLKRWIEQHPEAIAKNDLSAIDSMKWDPSVKALARFPEVVKKMSQDLQWTTDLGDAFVNQGADVTQIIQTLRTEAENAGNLKSTPQQTVGTVSQGGTNYITIDPTQPGVVYVPTYDPAQVYQPYYGAAPLLTFGAGILAGAIWSNNWWNWGGGWVEFRVLGASGAWRAGRVIVPAWAPNRKSAVPAASAVLEGSVGLAASEGSVGPAASEGSVGLAASEGSVGPAASEGSVGLAASEGSVGLAASEGPVGLAASEGSVGLAASAGSVGLAASEGSVGLAASEGSVGLAASEGSVGPAASTAALVPAASTAALVPAASTAGVAAAASAAGADATVVAADVAGAEDVAVRMCASSTTSCSSGGSTTASATIASSTTAATPLMSA